MLPKAEAPNEGRIIDRPVSLRDWASSETACPGNPFHSHAAFGGGKIYLELAMSDEVILQKHGRVAVVVLNDPKRLNAFSMQLKLRLEEVLGNLTQDNECGAIVLTGAGTSFSAGGDITEMRWRSIPEGRARLEAAQRIIRLIACGPKPVIAAVEGNAVGGGMSLALACDFVVAAENARFAASFVPRVGLLPDLGLMWHLSQRVGMGTAKHLLILGRAFDGTEALAKGVVDQVAPAGQALAAALDVAGHFASTPSLPLHYLKLTLANRVWTLDETLKAEIDYQAHLFQSADHGEATRAFLEKRKPVFSGERPGPLPAVA